MPVGVIEAAAREVAEEKPDRFNGFEPWDVAEREDWLIELAAEYGVTLDRGPKPFQSGYLFSTKFISINQGATQIGKSIPAWVEVVIQASGKIPLSLRTPKGVDTGVKRNIEDDDLRKENIKRWGRRDIATGKVIDHDPEVLPDGTWDCGTIIGAGLYPISKIPPHPAKIWICTYKQAKHEYWWPNFQNWTPEYLLDTERGVKGFGEALGKVYFNTGSDVTFITYEQGYRRAEAKMVWKIILDEEPPDRNFFVSCAEHCHFMSLHFTPYNGISWSYDDLYLQAGQDPNIELFHATQYDCPYKTTAEIMKRSSTYKSWDIEARVLGMYSEQRGKPYFDREKVNGWIKQHRKIAPSLSLIPEKAWETPDEIVGVGLSVNDHPDPSSGNMVWHVVEEPQDATAYWASIDTAEGSDDPLVEQGDYNACIVRRPPVGAEKFPPIVAYGMSQMKVLPFARECLYLAHWYNNCLICPEAKGESSGVFMSEITGWPFVLMMVVVNDITRKTTTKPGFITTNKSRNEAFGLVDEFINEHDFPNLPSLDLLKQMAACVRGKRGRPDHPRRGHDDLLVSFAISEWVWKNAPDQIGDHSSHSPKKDKRRPRWLDAEKETRPILGSRRGLDQRGRDKTRALPSYRIPI